MPSTKLCKSVGTRLFILLILSGWLQYGFCQREPYLADLRAKVERSKDTALTNALLTMGHFFIEEYNYDSAQFYYKKALALAEEQGYKRAIGLALGDLGLSEYRSARYATALDYYQRALKVALENKNQREIALTSSNIGELNIVIGNATLGLSQLAEAEKMISAVKDSFALISHQVRMAQLYLFLKDEVNGALYLNKAMTTCKTKLAAPELTAQDRIKLQSSERSILYSQSDLLRAENQPAKAVILLKQLIEELKEVPGGREKISYELSTAETYFEMQHYQQSLIHCDKTLAYLKIDSIPDLYSFAYELRSDIYAAMGQYANALRDFKLAKQINDSIFSREMMNKTAGLLSKQETERKNEQITYLNRERKMYKILVAIAAIAILIAGLALVLVYRSRKLQRKLLVQQNQIALDHKALENNRLQIRLFEQEQAALRAQMNPHFIFNSLNSIQYYVISHDIQGANRYISMLGSLIRLTLDYAAKPTILLREELAYLEKYLALEKMRMQDAFDYRITIPEGLDTEMYEIPPMLLQPFLENALKHGVAYLQNRKGFVELQIEQVGEGLQYTITDNGVGRAVTSQYNSGFATRTHQPKGIQLSEQRIAQLQKDGVMPAINIIDLHDNEGQPSGTQVVIVLP